MLFIHKTTRYFEAFECHIKKDELNIKSYKTEGYVFKSKIKKLNIIFKTTILIGISVHFRVNGRKENQL